MIIPRIILRKGYAHLRKYVRNKSSNISTNENIENISAMTFKRSDYIVWIDMEMTGLDPEKNKILELACLVTDGNLKTVSDEFHTVINQPDEELNSMDAWCTKHHERSGLTNASRTSTITNSDAELRLLEFLQKYVPKSTCPLAGNSIYMDRMFLIAHMPLVNEYLHHRIIDVSTLKEVVRRWNRSMYNERPQKSFSHRALDDIKESIQELGYYRNFMCFGDKSSSK